MNRTLIYLLLTGLLAGCPTANDDDSASDDDDAAGDDDDATGDDDDATGDDDDATGDDDDATGDDDDATGDDDDATGDDDDATTGSACFQNADHNLVVTVDPATMTSQAFQTERWYFSPAVTVAGTSVNTGDSVGVELVFDPPLSASRALDSTAITVAWSGAVPSSGETDFVTLSGQMSVPALAGSTMDGEMFSIQGGGKGFRLQVLLPGDGPDDGDIECLSAQFVVPDDGATGGPAIPQVGADAVSLAVGCTDSFCPPELFDGTTTGDDDDSADDDCDMWADNIFEVTLSASDFALTNDGSSDGVLRYDADFVDFGITPSVAGETYAFIAHLDDSLSSVGDWDDVRINFDNTYLTANDMDFDDSLAFVQLGSADLQPFNHSNPASSNGSALQWRPRTHIQPLGGFSTADPDQVTGTVSCIAFGIEGWDGGLLPSVMPMSRLTIRGDCAGSGANCGSNTLGFAGGGSRGDATGNAL